MREMTFRKVFIDLLRSAYSNARHGIRTRTTRPLTSRRLSSLAAWTTTRNQLIGCQSTSIRTEKLPRTQAKTFATTGAKNGQREIAVLGGGITGLTAAHYLARNAKNAHITLYEGSSRLGGWIHGEILHVGSGKNDKVLFQRGPRMLRPYSNSVKYDDIIFYDVVASLGLRNSLRLIKDTDPKARYIYYPDHLVEVPRMHLSKLFTVLQDILKEPLYEGAIKSAYNAFASDFGFKLKREIAQDESIGEFFDRMFRGNLLTKNVLSALIHGIYGGDVYKLSIKHSIFDQLWRRCKFNKPKPGHVATEAKDFFLYRDILNSPDIGEVASLLYNNRNVESMAFDDGLVTLANALIKDLGQQKNVSIKTNRKITSLAYEDGKILATAKTGSNETLNLKYDQVVSTIFSKHLASIVQPAGCLPSLEETQAVTMMVVNMWFPNPSILEDNHGFGYLIPTSTPDNDECLLGVLFDSDLQCQPDPIPGTKLTAMLGGHYWDGWTALPSEEMAEAMAKEAVYRHLNIDPSEPVFTTAKLCRDCIPQQTVGHKKRMADAHEDLMEVFKGRLSVAGPSYGGIGVLPAMRSGFDVAMAVAHGHGTPWFKVRPDNRTAKEYSLPPIDHVGMTGLKGFTMTDGNTLVQVHKKHMYGKKFSGE
ncbi:Protoporphyrinogen oxidase [Annulohypoxylon nitens]|nr:Protoporphyrinogen oxidase [Annulohypoxylon nitens]